jgi:lipase
VLLNLHEWGDREAPPVVCLHGVSAHGRRFRKLAEERLASRYRILAPDLRGHGRSSWEPPWTITQHVEDLAETLAAEGVERADVIGHSFGGRLTLELTANGLVRRSMLLDPVVWVPPPIALGRAQERVRDRSFANEDEALAERVPLSPLAPRELLEEEFREHLVRGDDGRLRFRYAEAAVIAAYGEMCQAPPDWARLQVSTLLVHGVNSDVVPGAVIDVLRSELGARLTVATVPGRHDVLWDAFEETADAVVAFLELDAK